MTLKRAITFDILEGAQEFPTVGLLGSRQAGKTTLSQLIFKDHAYVSLKDIETRAAATINPRAFLNANRNTSGLILDDFQYVPELLSYMQSEGNGDHTPGTYIVCGPHNSFTQELLAGYLEGNFSLYSLRSLSLRELSANYLMPSRVEEVLYRGLHPGAYAFDADPQAVYRDFLSSYIDRDVRLHGQVDNVTTFHTFLTHCALHVGQVLNVTTLAHASGISDHTARRWISLLEDHQIIFLLKPYHTTFEKRLIKSPKLYFYDPGIVCSLLKIQKDDLSAHPQKDKLFETLIMGELMKWSHQANRYKLYFWRDKSTHEIDCLLEGTDVIPVRIQTSTARTTFSSDLTYWHKLSGTQHKGFTISTQTAAPQEKEDHFALGWQFMQPLHNALGV